MTEPVTRDELVAFLDESEDTLTREEVREAILAAWDFCTAMDALDAPSDAESRFAQYDQLADALRRIRAVTR